MRNLANLLGFQLIWILSVWGAANSRWWLGPLGVAVFCALHFALRANHRDDLKLIVAAVVVGALVDSAFAWSGVLIYASPVPSVYLAPLWILSMWVGFALTLNHSMAWMKGRLPLQIAFGAIGGPLAYWIAGRAWGAVVFGESLPVVIALLAIAWGVVTPSLLLLSNHRDTKLPE